MCDNNERRNIYKMEGYNCCGVSCDSGSRRSFLTKEEKLELLKEYKESLDKESKGVSERIKELHSDK